MIDNAFPLLNEIQSKHRPDMTNGVCYEGDSFLARLSARDPEMQDVTYLLTSGSLPDGAFLDPSEGTITGTLDLKHYDTGETLKGDHTWYFNVGAFDGVNIKDQPFSITVKHINLPPVWSVSSGGLILEMFEGQDIAQATVTDLWMFTGTTGNATLVANGILISATIPFNNSIAQTTQDIIASVNTFHSSPVDYGASYEGGAYFKITSPAGTPALHSITTGDIRTLRVSGITSIEAVDSFGNPAVGNNAVGYKVLGVDDPEIDFNPNPEVNAPLVFRANGSLFNGEIANSTLALNANGVLTGSLPPVADQIVPESPFVGSARNMHRDFPFQVFAYDGEFDVPRTFSLRVKNVNVPPIFQSPATGNVGLFLENTSMSPITFIATDVDQDPLTYSISNVSANGIALSGIDVIGMSISSVSNTGVLTGIPQAFSVGDEEIANANTVWYIVDPTGLNSTLAGPSYLAVDSDGTHVFRSKAAQTTFVSDNQETTPMPGARYVIKYSIRKTQDDNSQKGFVRPAFDCFFANGVITIQGQRSGAGYVSDPNNVGYDLFDTSLWTLNQWYTISAEFTLPDPSPYVAIRGRIRLNRAAFDNGGPPYSDLTRRKDGPPYSNSIYEMRGTLLQQNDLSVYDFTVNASDGQYTVSRDFNLTIQHVDAPPVWDTPAGSLGTFVGNTAAHQQLLAHDPEGKPVTYSLANSTTLPVGLSLTGGGLITGNIANIATNTVFSVTASDGAKTTDRSFQMNVIAAAANLPPVWDTPAGDIPALTGFPGDTNSFQLVAHDPEGDPLTFFANTALPAGFSMTSGGLITGTHQFDRTPDPVNWTDTSATGPTDDSFIPGVSIGGNTNTQGITGINTHITLNIACNRTLAAGENLAVYINGTLSTASIIQGGTNVSFDVVNGDVVLFRFGGYHTTSVVFTVINTSDGSAVLDTFNSSLTKT
jgi:hypothetical protein